jgi:hypothetical protein
VMPFDDACDLGLRFRQDAIFHVSGDHLSVTYCDERRALVPVGLFRERIDGSHSWSAGAPLSDQSDKTDASD